jgi:ATP phosphoribosyltransferase regulatory subunit
MNIKSYGVPLGLKDYLPQESNLKRFLENNWQKLFSAWGYEELVTPSLEYYNSLVNGLENNDTPLHKMIDRDGNILALRPDMTNPIARLVASRFKSETIPMRFFYIANVFRNEKELQKAKQREFYQAGVELLGVKNFAADTEVILLALEALEAAGLKDYEIGLGNVNITKDLIEILCPDELKQKKIKEALTKKNYVDISKILVLNNSPKESAIKELISGQWRDTEIIERLKGIVENEQTIKAIEDLGKVLDSLINCGFSDKVFVDLSILRDFDYYTGIVFEGYSPRLGYPLLGGGRYDNLLSKYGYDCYATGFAMGIDRIMAVLPEKEKEKKDYLVMGKNFNNIYLKAQKLREEGKKVEIDINNMSYEDAEKYAQNKGIKKVIFLEGD